VREALEDMPCTCVVVQNPAHMTPAALDAGAMFEITQRCRRCAALAFLEVKDA